MSNFKIAFILNSLVSPESISGGDRISIELCKGWQRRGCLIKLFLCKDGISLCQKEGLHADYRIISDFSVKNYGLFLAYFLRIFYSLFIIHGIEESSIIFSSSDFLTDTIPAYLMKGKNKNTKWITGFYLLAPSPFKGEAPLNIHSILYFLNQILSIYMMRKNADLIFVLNEIDKVLLAKRGIPSQKIEVVSGGVDLRYISGIRPDPSKSYDGCFLGRIHPQKGIIDLIKIWDLVCRIRTEAKLAIIGWGDKKWDNILKGEIRRYNLQERITLLGMLDGKKKFQVLKSSKVFLFPSNHESWGVSICEAMACGLPVVAYELPFLRTIFPEGIIYVPLGDTEAFSKNILSLLSDTIFYRKLQEGALRTSSGYDWDSVADTALSHLNVNFIKHEE